MGIFMSLHNMKTTKEIEANITEEIAVIDMSTESEAKLTYEEFWYYIIEREPGELPLLLIVYPD